MYRRHYFLSPSPSSHRLLPTSQLIPNGVWCGEEKNTVQGFRIFEPKRIKIKGRCIFIFIVQVPSRIRTVVKCCCDG